MVREIVQDIRLSLIINLLIIPFVFGQSDKFIAQEKLRRPNDPWPKTNGIIFLATPGSPIEAKGLLAPGGSFSPGLDSFGISLWVTDIRGNIKESTDTIPLNQIKQGFEWSVNSLLPSVFIQHDWFNIRWSCIGQGQWRLKINTSTPAEHRIFIILRRAGPSNGRINSLEVQQNRLIINGGWSILTTNAPLEVLAGHEGSPNWFNNAIKTNKFVDPTGWAFAKIPIHGTNAYEFEIISPRSRMRANNIRLSPFIQVSTPQPEFEQSLFAQLAIIAMSSYWDTSSSTYPALNVPHSTSRTLPLILEAMSAAGAFDFSKELAKQLSINDYGNLYSPDADFPGLSIWALESLSARISDPGINTWLWPHIVRKARIITSMMSAALPVYINSDGNIVTGQNPSLPTLSLNSASTPICLNSTNKLVLGYVSRKPEFIYSSATAYAGLEYASIMADRMGDFQIAALWRETAANLRQSWTQLFTQNWRIEPLSLYFALWPSEVVFDFNSFYKALTFKWSGWNESSSALPAESMSIAASEAHQFLTSNNPEMSFSILNWLWKNQSSPGLYVWHTDTKLSSLNTARRTKNTTYQSDIALPDLETAAQVVLLQIDMLCRTERGIPRPILIIGSGIPKKWLEKPISISGIPTRAGIIAWKWSDETLTVSLPNKSFAVRLGPSFPPNTKLIVK
jgi:hypothetical protein